MLTCRLTRETTLLCERNWTGQLSVTSYSASSVICVDVICVIYIYAFSRRFYPKRLTLHSSYSFYILSALAFPENRTHDLGVAIAMLYHLSYRKAVSVEGFRLRCCFKVSILNPGMEK